MKHTCGIPICRREPCRSGITRPVQRILFTMLASRSKGVLPRPGDHFGAQLLQVKSTLDCPSKPVSCAMWPQRYLPADWCPSCVLCEADELKRNANGWAKVCETPSSVDDSASQQSMPNAWTQGLAASHSVQDFVNKPTKMVSSAARLSAHCSLVISPFEGRLRP